MKIAIASSMTLFVMTVWPCSIAYRSSAVRATPFTWGGTRSMRASASSVQEMISSARTSSGG